MQLNKHILQVISSSKPDMTIVELYLSSYAVERVCSKKL